MEEMNDTKATPDAGDSQSASSCQNFIEMEATTTTTATTAGRKKRPLEDKICRVCGDKALAHNFDVITCESCKAFFRRNAFKRDELRECAFQRSCPINVRTRRFCSACRLKKCFEIGMRADMILDEGRRQVRSDKRSKKRNTRDGASGADNPTAHCSSLSPDDFRGCGSLAEQENDHAIGNRTNARASAASDTLNAHVVNSADCSHHHHHYHHQPPTADVANTLKPSASSNPVVSQQVTSPPACPPPHCTWHHPGPAPAKDLQPVPSHLLPSDPHMYWRLSEEERALLTHISATYQSTILRLPQLGGAVERSERAVTSLTLEELLGRCDVCAHNVVKLMKGLVDYRKLQVEDQVAALKACAMRTFILKGAACFVVERDAWVKACGEVPVSLFVRVTGHEKLIRQHAEFCRSLKILLRNDVTLYALLQCVMLFDPREPSIADRQLVNTLRDKYLQLLKHYLESQVSYAHADAYLEFLRQKLVELKVLAEKMTLMFKEWTALIQPLMIEVLSLA